VKIIFKKLHFEKEASKYTLNPVQAKLSAQPTRFYSATFFHASVSTDGNLPVLCSVQGSLLFLCQANQQADL